MSPFGKGLLLSAVALGLLLGSSSAQPKADAGSGPTSGAASANNAGSGPTSGAKPNANATTTKRTPLAPQKTARACRRVPSPRRVSACYACGAAEMIYAATAAGDPRKVIAMCRDRVR